ncbi:hypothetical protein HGA88_05090 [Candidatus Roizmanbacteria bacterium]|nr:hypothetical protein [Candidatus Roizmanbacteria bacterium]
MTYSEIIKQFLPQSVSPELSTNLILFAVPHDRLTEICTTLYTTHSLPLKTIKAADERATNGVFKIMYIFAVPHEKYFLVPYVAVKEGQSFPSLVKHIYESLRYEQEIHSMFGLLPEGNVFLQPFILHENWPQTSFPLRKDFKGTTRPAMIDATGPFQKIEGEGIYEIPVGPVHAGIIEPGHFRFSVAGEEIISLEPKLGYTHKGSEKLFESFTIPEMIKLSERISGDTSFTQSLAFCQAIEQLGGIKVPKRASYLRVIYSELERMANHLNDVGFILNDTAFSFGGSYGTRLREQIIQLCEELTGHRFLRGVNTIGGVTKDISPEKQQSIGALVRSLKKDFEELIEIVENKETVLNRLRGTGVLEKQTAHDYGVVGIAARASDIPVDARIDYPYAAYPDMNVQVAKRDSGDVYARYNVRIQEVINAIHIILHALNNLPSGQISQHTTLTLKPNSYTVSITEGWRGDIVYFVATDTNGKVSRVGIRDASFLNWPAVPQAVVGNIVPDFPLINKSFNLSYSGFDR